MRNKVGKEMKGRPYYKPFWLEWTAQKFILTVRTGK